jgi:hypothetical protein
MSAYSQSAMEILRNPQLTMKWYVVPLLLIVMYIYTKQMHDKNWNVVLGGLALWGMDIFNEIWNSIVFHATGFAPVWGTPATAGGHGAAHPHRLQHRDKLHVPRHGRDGVSYAAGGQTREDIGRK